MILHSETETNNLPNPLFLSLMVFFFGLLSMCPTVQGRLVRSVRTVLGFLVCCGNLVKNCKFTTSVFCALRRSYGCCNMITRFRTTCMIFITMGRMMSREPLHRQNRQRQQTNPLNSSLVGNPTHTTSSNNTQDLLLNTEVTSSNNTQDLLLNTEVS